VTTRTSARWLRRTGFVLIALALAGLMNLVVNANASAQDEQADPQLVQQGNTLYQENCARCHGGTGLGVVSDEAAAGPPLINVGAASVDFMIASGRMPAESQYDSLIRREPVFNDTERQALVAYVTQLEIPDNLTVEEAEALGIPDEPGPGIPDISDWEDGDLAEGRALFTANCAACHGPTAAGIAVGQNDVSSNLAGVPPLQVAEAIRSGPGVMPVFSDEVLTDEELDATVAWVMNLPERESPGGINVGRSGPVTEGLLAWVIGMGLLGVAVYVLGERIGTTDPDEESVSTDGGGA
jgi:ubiquinol-cytochrome c reductase cytochrome c subunit